MATGIGAIPRGDRGMGQDVFGARRLLDPGDRVVVHRSDPVDRLGDVPALVRVDRDLDGVPDGPPREREAPAVVVEVRPDLELDLGEAVRDGLLREGDELLVAVAEPARRRRVRRVAGGFELGDASSAPGLRGAEDVEGLVAGERVGEVAEVDDVDDLLGRHPRQQAPQRQAGALGAQVPQGVEDGAGGHVHDALLRAEPAQLRVVDEESPGAAEVGEELFGVEPDDVVG